MSVFVSDKLYRNGLEYLKTNGKKAVVSSVVSEDYATLVETPANMLAVTNIDTTATTITSNTGSEGGFSLTFPELRSVTVDRAGTHKQLVIYDDVNNDILVITPAEEEKDLIKNDVINLDPVKVTIGKAT